MKPGSSNKIKWIHLRLSETEHRLLVKRSSDSTCRNLSQYLRLVIFERPIVATYRNRSQDDMIQQLAMLNRELAAIGNNLNQVTKKMHTLQPAEKRLWGEQFDNQAQALLLKIVRVKAAMDKIAGRWLR